MPGIGVYAGTEFDAVSIDEHWNYLYTTNSGISRELRLDAQYSNNPDYIGGAPASGISLDEMAIRSIPTSSQVELFAIRLGIDPEHGYTRLAVVFKAIRGDIYSWSGYGSTVDVDTYIYKRVWTDATTYTDTQLSRVGCRIPLTTVHAHLEFFEYGDSWIGGISNYFTDGNQIKALWSLWYPERSAYDTEFDNLTPDGKDKTSPEFGPASEPEGYEPTGGYNGRSDLIDLPPKPQSVLSLGFINVYKCSAGSLTQLGAELFPEIQFPTSLSDVGAVLAALSDSIWNSKLIDYVISVHCVPGDVTAGSDEDIKIGARTMLGIRAGKITDEYVDVDFGSISIDPYFKNYADYMTEIQLYLPMYGFISLKPEEIIGGEIKVVYRINVIDGSFQAFVFATSNRSALSQSLIGQYGGSCVVHLPVSNLSYASMFSSLVGAGAAAAGVATGGAGMVAGALSTTNLITQAAQGGDVKKSNSYNASSSFMTRMKPYAIVSRPVPSFSTRYNIENGLPSNVAMTLGACRGFTTAENAILDNIPCTQEEKSRIQSYLKSGIIIK